MPFEEIVFLALLTILLLIGLFSWLFQYITIEPGQYSVGKEIVAIPKMKEVHFEIRRINWYVLKLRMKFKI